LLDMGDTRRPPKSTYTSRSAIGRRARSSTRTTSTTTATMTTGYRPYGIAVVPPRSK